MKKYIFLVLISWLAIAYPYAVKSQTFAENSVLAQRECYKIGIAKSGVYKLDYSFLKNLGILKASIDPRNIRVYGNGGAMLPQLNNTSRPDDLLENAVYIEGEDDGKFDKADYILFYGESPEVLSYNLIGKQISVKKNIYSDTSYYFITVSDDPGKRLQQLPDAGGGTLITTYDDFIYHEKDLKNILSTDILDGPEAGSGRDWYGEEFDYTLSHSFNLDFNGIDPGSNITLFSSVLGSSSEPSNFSITINDKPLGNHLLSQIVEGVYNIKGTVSEKTFTISPDFITSSTNNSLKYSYDKQGHTKAIAFLNFFTLNFKRELKVYNGQTIFRSFESLKNSTSRFQIGDFKESYQIWDITKLYEPQYLQYNLVDNTAEFSVTTSTLREFVAFDANKLFAPVSFGRIANQNLHAVSSPQLLIITHNAFKNEAKRLAGFKQSKNISTEVVTTSEIYNEFSSGKQDISALRDYIRFLYLKGNKGLKYVLLFGDCSYDYKNRVKNNTNFVPVYESRESLHPIRSYSSDDYYGFMESEEGEWNEEPNGDHTLDVAIGRIPCKTLSEARNTINKIINYSDNKNTLGNWRNNIYMVADDGDANTHLKDADKLATKIDTSFSFLNIKKIFLDAYPQESTPNITSVKTKEAINQAIQSGAFILNYTGHGGETGWTNEKILDIPQINSWTNKDRLPLIVSATCEFGRYDDPLHSSAAELTLLNPRGGSIALVTTTRPVFSSTNYVLNKAFYESVFLKKDGRMPTLGEIMMYTKNESLNGTVNRNFALLGDPSLTLAYPQDTIEVFEMDNKNVKTSFDTLKALSTITFKGNIKNGNAIRSDFNGILQVVIYDKPTTITTLGNENPVTQFSSRESVIFRGAASVVNGTFSFSFTVPKNINYQYGKAKISLYAYNAASMEDAKGVITNIIIGGSSTDFPIDNNPPNIKLYLNDSTFKSGDKVNKNPQMIAEISDESAINITNTIVGQDLKALLTSDDSKEISLNDYYAANIDDPTSGSIHYPFSNLKQGKYSLSLKAWDIYNNSSESTIAFIVTEDGPINISELFNFPNPFNDLTGTTFVFSHDAGGEDLEVLLNIHTSEGRLIKTIKEVIYKSEDKISDLKWDGKDDSGNKIPNGLYVYRLQLRYLSNKNISYRSEKLVLMH